MIGAALVSLVGREYKRVVRRPARLASTFARPLIWLIIIGSGFSVIIPGGEFSYHKYLLPGIIGMVILFSSLLGALGSVHDREFGTMRMLLISPLPRSVIVLGKTMSSALLGGSFAIALLPLAWVFDIDLGPLQYAEFVGAALLTGLALSSFGMLVASRMRQLENFAVVMNFVIFPMFFLSGALYLTEGLPGFLQPLVRVNPLTYGVDLIRHVMLAGEPQSWSRVEFSALWDIGYLVIFTILALALAGSLFGRDEHLSAIFLARVKRRVPIAERAAGWAPAWAVRWRSGPPSSRRREIAATTLSRQTRLTAPRPATLAGEVTVAIRGAVSGVVQREFKRALRQRGRLISTFARPLIWMIAVGAGFAALIPSGHYQKFLMPGIIGMVILFSTMLSALGSVHDRQFGPMRMLLVAPVPRSAVVIGKVVSSALIGIVFAVLLSPLAWVFGIEMSFMSLVGYLGAVALSALCLSALGMLVASFVRHLEDFAVAMNFVIFPMFFFSGALYPADNLPAFLQPVVRLNPLTYGVDLMRQTMLSGEPQVLSPVRFTAGFDVAFLMIFAVVAVGLALEFFGKDERLTPMFLGGGARRRAATGRRQLPWTGQSRRRLAADEQRP